MCHQACGTSVVEQRLNPASSGVRILILAMAGSKHFPRLGHVGDPSQGDVLHGQDLAGDDIAQAPVFSPSVVCRRQRGRPGSVVLE